jgi:hypothetical protein
MLILHFIVVWNLENLLNKYGSIDVLASTIPYATLFGRSEVSVIYLIFNDLNMMICIF